MSIAAKMLAATIGTSLFIVAWVVVVGGIVCIKDDDYAFGEYVSDLTRAWTLLLTAVAGCVVQAWMVSFERKNGG